MFLNAFPCEFIIYFNFPLSDRLSHLFINREISNKLPPNRNLHQQSNYVQFGSALFPKITQWGKRRRN